MDNLKAVVSINAIGLPQDKVNKLQSSLAKGSLSYLSPEKEAGPFMLYYCGDTLEDVAVKSNYPVDIIYLTAMKYNWPDKSKNLRSDLVKDGMEAVQKDLLQMMLLATHITVQKQLADVIAGRIDGKDSSFVPKNINGVKQLIEMLESTKPKPIEGQTVNNIQVNLQNPKDGSDAVILDIPKSKVKRVGDGSSNV